MHTALLAEADGELRVNSLEIVEDASFTLQRVSKNSLLIIIQLILCDFTLPFSY